MKNPRSNPHGSGELARFWRSGSGRRPSFDRRPGHEGRDRPPPGRLDRVRARPRSLQVGEQDPAVRVARVRGDAHRIPRVGPAARLLVHEGHVRERRALLHDPVGPDRAVRPHLDRSIHLPDREPRDEGPDRHVVGRVRVPHQRDLRVRLDGREIAREAEAARRIVVPVPVHRARRLLLLRERRLPGHEHVRGLAHDGERPRAGLGLPDERRRGERRGRDHVHVRSPLPRSPRRRSSCRKPGSPPRSPQRSPCGAGAPGGSRPGNRRPRGARPRAR